MTLTVPHRFSIFRPALGLLLAVALVACERSVFVDDPAQTIERDSAPGVIGLAGGAAIKLVDIERIVSLELYDLEMQALSTSFLLIVPDPFSTRQLTSAGWSATVTV